jgi:hypothetical protein
MMYSFFGSLWGRMASCAPIANRRKLARAGSSERNRFPATQPVLYLDAKPSEPGSVLSNQEARTFVLAVPSS